MPAVEAVAPQTGIAEVAVTRVSRSGVESGALAAIQEEGFARLYVNGRFVEELRCSPSSLDELAVGHMLTEGAISRLDDVRSMRVDGASSSVYMEIGGVPMRPFAPLPAVEWEYEAVFRIADEFALDKTAHARTRGAHSAFLCCLDGHILCMREDVGRHNAFDKAIGWALLNGIDLARCMLYTSGRVPSDVAAKAISAGIPVLVSKSVATDQGIALARAYGLTLICEAKPLQFDLVNG